MNIANKIIELYPNVVRVENNEKAFDANGDEVAYDLEVVTTQVEADEQAKASAKTAALAKLTALGLTPADLTALGL